MKMTRLCFGLFVCLFVSVSVCLWVGVNRHALCWTGTYANPINCSQINRPNRTIWQ